MKLRERIYLLDRLWELQNSHGYLSAQDLQQISKEFGLSPVDIEGVSSFYHFFKHQPAGKYTIYLNISILAKFNGFDQVKEAFEDETGAYIGGTDPTGLFGLYETSCIGLSDHEPSALINFCPFTKLTKEKVGKIVQELRSGKSPVSIADTINEEIQYTPGTNKTILLREYRPGTALTSLEHYLPEQVIDKITNSGLSGRGGAFFPTGTKWELCRKAEGSVKYIVCNADEGEPGTFKDRALLNLLPGLLLEGMIIAGYAIGAQKGIIYLRAEYSWLLPKINKAINNLQEKGFLNQKLKIAGDFQFDIRVQMGAGAYICGEETALLESMEGKRGEPRLKTFFPTQKGFCNKPTLVDNVETFCAASRILELGFEKFKSLGTTSSSGTKLLSVSGDCENPGIYEIEWGISIGALLDMCGAKSTMYIQLNGPSGELLSINEKDRILAGEDILCEGSVMIFDETRDLFTILHNFLSFFTHESCGLCTPCRAGNPQLLQMLEKIIQGHETDIDLIKIQHLANVIKYNSRCGLGQTAPNSLKQAISKFPQLFLDKISKTRQNFPDFDLQKAIQDYNDITHGK